ncbi:MULTISPECIES: flagellar hook-associated protein FlgK [Edwardsiella]|uniref:Flagellar hook-associated protein 1 n=2 Tax=Edwardsiella anguillarum TaxID=1821960 RepID=A0A076LSH4_9GAMM|nr:MULTISPECIES: flagellar hook-associated protein FlgK [Edwardsiella]ELM3656709.1 flagellar hook-associated protein FlgK [Edwardsiella piscicida]AIJ09607.1 Flagellar hook-associated protein FlgK [Edwardsiella anguillarum ET080813]AKR77364.1 flagellar hook-associated protein FlgK [Edwardsiella sp. LADL05-105]KAB0592582.1 flagellar hook-associated protein FlgK [Edwardsiella anguillarum]RFT01887.1 flagellar hook-associated protein FlgK [Edwardsiella anguillarum]
MANLINNAMSGLSAAQTALAVTSNNINNVYTAGYNRQTVSFAENNGTSTPAGFIGNGVVVSGINREYNQFIVNQLRQGQSDLATTSTYHKQISQIDNLLADSTNSLSANMQNFFKNLQNLVSYPSDSAARQTVISNANGLTAQFKTTDAYLRNLESSTNVTVSNNAEQINDYAKQIANLNNRISELTGASGGTAPNDLLDLRDKMASELNQIVNVDISMQDGAMNVSFAGGLSLVQGGDAYSVKAVPSSSDPSRTTLAYDRGNGLSEVPEARISGGSMAGIFRFRNEALDNTRNQLGQIALSMANAFNQVQSEGVDLNGDKGGDLFGFGQPESLANTNNTSKTSLSASYDDISKVQATDYRIDFKDGKWNVTRLADGTHQTITPEADGGDTVLKFDGLKVKINDTPAENDSFKLRTTSTAISGFDVKISDPAKIAAGSAKGEVGDNTNAQKMLDLQNQKIVGGKATLSGAYAGLVGTIGNQTNGAKVDSTAQGNVVKQLTKEQQSVSGVNLDEEYGDLVRFQQYYMANAQVIQTATSMFNALLDIR